MSLTTDLAHNFLQHTVRPGSQRHENLEGRAIHVLWSSSVPSTYHPRTRAAQYHPAVVDVVDVVAVSSQQLVEGGGGDPPPILHRRCALLPRSSVADIRR
jgi:hypothetical protein